MDTGALMKLPWKAIKVGDHLIAVVANDPPLVAYAVLQAGAQWCVYKHGNPLAVVTDQATGMLAAELDMNGELQ